MTHTLFILAEVTDQNFVDEDIKEEKEVGSCDGKSIKMLILNASSNDQVIMASMHCVMIILSCHIAMES